MRAKSAEMTKPMWWNVTPWLYGISSTTISGQSESIDAF